jgi:hypothetical protein
MRVEFLALYGGPDQVMGVTSGLASILGLLLIFWNKLGVAFFKVVAKLKGTPQAGSEVPKADPTETQ